MHEGWVKRSLGEVARVTSGFAFSTKHWRETGIPVIKINNVRDGHVSLTNCSFVSDSLPDGASRFLLKKGDLLITLTGEIGAVGFVTQSQPMYLNQRVGRIDLLENKNVLLDFLGLFLTLPEIRAEMWSHGKGNAQLNISPTSIHSLKINLPPLSEQKRIVDLVSSVDSYIKTLQQQLDGARKSRNAVLHELLTAGGEEWVESKLSGVTELITDGSHFSPQTTDTGIPYVTVRDIKDGQLDLANSARISKESFDELEKSGCRPLVNDILFSKDGTVGKVSLVSTNQKFVVLSSLAIIRANTNKILPKFLAITLSAPEFQRDAIGSKTGLAIKRIVLKHLRELSIKIPPILDQKRIIELVEVLDEGIKTAQQTLTESQRLRSSLLSDLLSGEHKIPASYDKVMVAAG
jgi:restriction endonuclease S subunit